MSLSAMTFLAITPFWAEKAEQFSVKSNSAKTIKWQLVWLQYNEIQQTFVSFHSLKATYPQAQQQLPLLLKFGFNS